MSDMEIQSHKGVYTVEFKNNAFDALGQSALGGKHFIIDKKVADIYSSQLAPVLESSSVLLIEATEQNKTLDKFTGYVEHLVDNSIRRNHTLVAIGGGIIQDITCFLSATLLRGVPWIFYPTTLLAQADSCIGSKSSINVGKTKNILGTFTPPSQIFIDTEVLGSLEETEVKSGVGEMLKVHGIDGPDSFAEIADDYSAMMSDHKVMEKYVFRSLDIKKQLIEIDEFDQGVRNIMNYGHSFGHAIESATDFGVPHGVAVTMGLDMAGYVAWKLDVGTSTAYKERKSVLQQNYKGYETIDIPLDRFFSAIGKDKKNTDGKLKLILPDKSTKIFAGLYDNDETFRQICTDYFLKEL